MATGFKSGGRKAGVENKTTVSARENMIAVFTRLGGTAAMADWARDNLTEFYKLYARLIPTEIAPVKFEHTVSPEALEALANMPRDEIDNMIATISVSMETAREPAGIDRPH